MTLITQKLNLNRTTVRYWHKNVLVKIGMDLDPEAPTALMLAHQPVA
jgi:hypothetical protein